MKANEGIVNNETFVRQLVADSLCFKWQSDRHERQDELNACYARLAAAGYSVIECASHLDRAKSDYHEANHVGFLEVLGTSRSSGFFEAWALGYYLVNAWARVGAVLDGVLNMLLCQHLSEAELTPILHWPPTERIKTLLEFRMSPDLRTMLMKLRIARRCSDFRIANGFLTKSVDRLSEGCGFSEIYYRVSTLSGARCVLGCVGINNTYKHLPRGMLPTAEHRLRADFQKIGPRMMGLAWAVLAIQFLAELLRLAQDH
jgi:hypothetical protein